MNRSGPSTSSGEPIALALLSRLRQGEDWDTLAAGNSLDTSNKDTGGDLGWFSRGTMVDAFEQAAFAGEIGEIVGPVQSFFGWHLIQIVDRGPRKLDEAGVRAAAQQALTTWLASAVETADLTFDPELVPPTETPTPLSTGQGGIEGSTGTPEPVPE
jgi:parvulin-like peptidyl-prolyl isomerase